MTIEDTLHAILDVLQQIAESRPTGSSNIDIEDMAKGPPKVTTHGSVGTPLTEEFIVGRVEEHALAHRLAQQAFDARWVEGWAATLEVLKAENEHPSHRDLTESQLAELESLSAPRPTVGETRPHHYVGVKGMSAECCCGLPETASVHHGPSVRPEGRDPNPFDRYQETARA